MKEEFEQLNRTTVFLSSESRQSQTPRGTRLTAHRCNRGRTPHARPSVLKEPLHQKRRSQTAMLTRAPNPSQGGLPLEDRTCWMRHTSQVTRCKSGPKTRRPDPKIGPVCCDAATTCGYER